MLGRVRLGSLLGGVILLGWIGASCAHGDDLAQCPGGNAGMCEPVDGGADSSQPAGEFGEADSMAVTGCTADLRATTDAQGRRVADCPPSLACNQGKCVDACAAHAATQGSLGCDFVVSTPSSDNMYLPPCFTVFLANGWTTEAHITVSRAGTAYDVTEFGRMPVPGEPPQVWPPVPTSGLPAGQVAVLFLSSDPNSQESFSGSMMTCPIRPAINASTAVEGAGKWMSVMGRGAAFHIQTDAPVTAYDILPFGGRSSYLAGASLLYPTSAWGTNYLAAVPQRGLGGTFSGLEDQWAQVVASSDGTTVTLLPTVDLPSGPGVIGAPRGVATTYSLNAGEFVQWQDTREMSGTIVSADKPIAFIGGYATAHYGGPIDSIHQQIPPIRAWGHEYAVAAFPTRNKDHSLEPISYRLVGAVDGTRLTYDWPTAGPDIINAGQVADFAKETSFVVRSQDADHPFFIGQHMSSCAQKDCVWSEDGGGGPNCVTLGDPEFVAQMPVAQQVSNYLFFTDPTYGTTYLVFTRRRDVGGYFHDVTLDCVGTVSGWTKIGGGAGEFETASVALFEGGVRNGSCDNGQHMASSDAPFGLTVWGLDEAVSYAYSAGGHAAPLNAVEIAPVVPK
ncbi:hypothetical protein AKJ09_07341 [Labilithrix luteola]|uniref:IgGFc-binding protein N-terminal domain-containing protein n=2 Tax=Labilithrix luteola TaxID=1391654 RepID=A0A0K1Q4L8_9BACT|nr:hypothetical protein AKJ09_07341 [Labilithrix luteola]